VFRKNRTPVREGTMLQVTGTLHGINAGEAHFEVREPLSLGVTPKQLSDVITDRKSVV
jgi:hypothetical protein